MRKITPPKIHACIFLDEHNQPWFVAKDVAELLGYKRERDAVKQHCKGAVKHRLPTSSGIQEMSIIPERDVWRLVMKSKLPAAVKFESWVFDEVIPFERNIQMGKIIPHKTFLLAMRSIDQYHLRT
ncbi:MAG: Bro-N domain-containing protein [Algoriphagus sp.]|uniref:BRO-N domain-containing protein n=1 Tax=Algoriphagus sp. TaxID=1872435 RepID=UPI002604BB1B|nr:Bro-N domain-containing protein [Algoriphagus sp.]MDG1276992.1 Bro-N domain-containing protein [Algoriphagus sp.]